MFDRRKAENPSEPGGLLSSALEQTQHKDSPSKKERQAARNKKRKSKLRPTGEPDTEDPTSKPGQARGSRETLQTPQGTSDVTEKKAKKKKDKRRSRKARPIEDSGDAVKTILNDTKDEEQVLIPLENRIEPLQIMGTSRSRLYEELPRSQNPFPATSKTPPWKKLYLWKVELKPLKEKEAENKTNLEHTPRRDPLGLYLLALEVFSSTKILSSHLMMNI